MNKTQEALKMANEALKMAIEALEDAQSMIGDGGSSIPDYFKNQIQACKEALAELALEQMAQNAREIDLVYCKHGSDGFCKECAMEEVDV